MRRLRIGPACLYSVFGFAARHIAMAADRIKGESFVSAFQRIDIAEAERVAAREDAVLMDVREPWDFERGHLNGARNVGQRDIPAIVDDIPKSTPLVIYCYHGNSSQLYAKYLASLGFAEVYSVDGGYEAWQALRLAESAQYLDAASIDTQDEMGMSPLMAAAYIGRTDIVGTLLSQGASADLANNEGNRELWFACASDVPEILDAIIAASADVDQTFERVHSRSGGCEHDGRIAGLVAV
ncbi:MAG: rhodanese-like domain-containing protein, partial [Pseudomonadota bacterium]